jgi:hypothetical protein
LALGIFFAAGRNFGINRPFASGVQHSLQEVSEKTVSMTVPAQPDTVIDARVYTIAAR